MRILLLSLFSFFSLPLFAQLPESDVWIFTFDYFSGTYTFVAGKNISNQKGYDNQPAFSENGSYMLWTSQRDSNQTDIYRYDVDRNASMRITQTAYSEYSPTFMPGNKNYSSVVVEKDSVQRLWKINKTTGDRKLVLPKVYQVGYHCWFDERTVFLFQVTEPSRLLIADVRSGANRTCVNSVGRCMQIYKSVKQKMLLYVNEQDTAQHYIMALDGKGNKVTEFKPIPMLKDVQDFIVDHDGNLIAGKGSKLYKWKIGISTGWEQFADLASYGITKITRLSMSPDNSHIALVDNPQ
jgi:WD40-like Beta Propeller Repeat